MTWVFPLSVKLQEYNNYTFPLAVAIVLSSMYEDDLDIVKDVVYTGQGGHNLIGDKSQIRDHVLERRNLALKVCIQKVYRFPEILLSYILTR